MTDLTEPDVTIAAQPLLNSALNEDKLDDGWVRTATAVIFLVSPTAENDSGHLDLLQIERH